MARQIIESPPELPSWLQGLGVPTVQRMLAWEAAQAQDCLADVFGYHALQAGWSGVEALAHNRMPHRWRAGLEFDGLDRAIDARISRLRKKLGDNPDTPTRIKTVRGKGYLFSRSDWE